MRAEFDIILSNWQDICKKIQESGNLSDMKIKNFYMPLKPQKFEDNTLYLYTKHYDKTLILADIEKNVKRILSSLYNIDCDIEFTENEIYIKSVNPGNKKNVFGLDPSLTFENFIPGSHNLAHGCAIAVANNPGTTMNPLFLYGNSGLGKTHLLNAIGNQVLKNNPNAKLVYTTIESLLQEYVDSTMNNTISKFKKKYRVDIDLLLVDDIQFLPPDGKKLGEEVFHIFNELIQRRKQIVLTADKPPKELVHIEDRLVTRFNQGTSVEVLVPNFETRMAIIKHLQEEYGTKLNYEAISFIANNIKSNIRQLTGSMQKVYNSSMLDEKYMNRILTVEDAKELASEYIDSIQNREITVDLIVDIVAEHYKVTSEGIISKSRKKELIKPRHIVMYLALNLTNLTQEEIGKCLGNRDHSTISNGRDKITNELLTNKSLEKNLVAITNKLNPKS